MPESRTIELPQLGESVTEATITRWIKNVGAHVAVGDVLAEVSTDKVDTEISSTESGVLIAIAAEVGATIQVGEPLAVVETVGADALSGPSKPDDGEPAQPAATRAAAGQQSPVQRPDLGGRDRSAPAAASTASLTGFLSPLVRRLSAKHQLDPADLRGTGRDHRVTKADVLSAAEGARAAKVAMIDPARSPTKGATAASGGASNRDQSRPLGRLRNLTAHRMAESLAPSAQLTSVLEVDVSEVVRLRNQVRHQFSASEGVPLTFLPFFAKAAVDALRQFPEFNASLDMPDGSVRYDPQQQLAIAVDTEQGLVAPVIHDAGDLSISGLSRAIANAAARARNNSLSPDELDGGTFTLTNTGSRGALFDTPMIYQPQVAVLGTGMIAKRPVVVSDAFGSDVIAIRSMMYLSLTYDRRLIDGTDAARFLLEVKARLESGVLGQELSRFAH